jgi:hypothetical protein
MPEYRAYIIGQDGHFQSSVNLECADDAEASEAAKKLLGDAVAAYLCSSHPAFRKLRDGFPLWPLCTMPHQ